MKRLHPPPAVLEIATQLEEAGFEAWCVGGAVRDAILGHQHLDWDLATSATPPEVKQLFGARRTIPVGVEFGTVGVLDRGGVMHEVTTFRRDIKTDGRHAEVEFGVSLDDDLARRDFTINAIAYSPRRQEIRDPFDGQGDLARKLVRAVGDPSARMREDRLRALRAIRFAARFEFEIDRATRQAIEDSTQHLGRLSPERVKQELDKTMEQVRCPSFALAVWQSAGAFATLVPPLAHATAAELSVPDYLAMPAVSTRPARRANRFAGLLLGLGPSKAADVMTALRSSRHETQAVVTLIDRWHAVAPSMTAAIRQNPVVTDSQVRTWVAEIGRLRVSAFMRLVNAVWHVERMRGQSAPAPETSRSLYRRMLISAFRDAIDLGSLAIDGDDLRRAGIPAGPGLGKILQALLTVVIENPSRNTADWLLQEAKRLYAARSSA